MLSKRSPDSTSSIENRRVIRGARSDYYYLAAVEAKTTGKGRQIALWCPLVSSLSLGPNCDASHASYMKP